MLIVPLLLLATFTLALINKVNIFESFAQGVRQALKLTLNILPYLISIFMILELFRVSGLSLQLSVALTPVFNLIGIPAELAELIILRPLSGSGSLAVLESIYNQYGVDSYIANCASVMMASSDTILYVCAVYFSTSKHKKTGLAIPIALFVSIVGAILSCLLVKLLHFGS